MNNKHQYIYIILLLTFSMVFLIPNVNAGTLLIGSPSPPQVTNAVIDLGHATTVNTIVSNGIAPYTGNWMWIAPNTIGANALSITTNTLTANILSGTLINSVLSITTSTASTNTIQVTFNGITNTINIVSGSTVYGAWAFSANALDSASNTLGGSNAITSNTITINPALNTPTISAISNTLIDAGQYSSFTPTVSGGSPAYVVNIIISNSITKAPINSITQTSSSPASKLFYFPSWVQGNTLQVNVVVTDSATTNVIANSIYTAFGFNAFPTISIGAPSNSIVDVGQYQSFLATTTGGTQNYQYTFNSVNSISTNLIVNSITFTAVSGTTQLWSYYIGNQKEPTNSPEEANVFVLDSTSGFANSIYSSTYKVGSVLTTPTLAVTNTVLVAGQYSTFTPTISGGSPSYIQNIVISNTITSKPINSIQVTVASGTAETLYFPSWYSGNTLQVNVVVTDSATTNVIANSIYTALSFNSILATPTISPSSSQSNTTGQIVTFAAYVTGGTAPYTYNFLVYNSITKIQVANMLTTSNSFAYTLPTGQAGNTLNANVFVTDNSLTPVTTNSILSGTITVSAASSGNSGGGGGIQGSGGSGVSGGGGSPSTTVSSTGTTSTVTTTIAPQNLNTTVLNSKYNVSSNKTVNINVQNVGLYLTIQSTSGSSSANVTVKNVTGHVPSGPSGFNNIVAINITLTSTASLSTNVTLTYPCSIQSSKIAPYKLKNGVWQPIANFTVNPASCSVTFSITKDPVIGLFQNVTQQTTLASTTTVTPTSQPTTTTQASSSGSGSSTLWIVAAIVVILIVVGGWFMTRPQTRRLK